MGLIMPDLVVVAHSANGMDPEGKTKSSEEPVDECSVAEVEDVFSEETNARSKKSILKTTNSEANSNGDRLKRTVSWHDYEGKELHTVREFEPSEHDDDEFLYQNEPEKKGGCCVIC